MSNFELALCLIARDAPCYKFVIDINVTSVNVMMSFDNGAVRNRTTGGATTVLKLGGGHIDLQWFY
jgi:hypothetical protein